MSNDRSEFPAVATAFIVGALAGAVVGLLLAPKPGRETREDLREFGKGLGDKAAGASEAARSSAEDWFDRAATAVNAAKKAYRETRASDLAGGRADKVGGMATEDGSGS